MPKTVELLDLSYNDITNIDADCFEVSRTICHGNKVVKSSIKKYILVEYRMKKLGSISFSLII